MIRENYKTRGGQILVLLRTREGFVSYTVKKAGFAYVRGKSQFTMECATTSDGVNLPTDSCQIGSPAGSKTPDTPSRCRSPGSPIGDDACPICLGAFTDKCAAGSCLHNFCLNATQSMEDLSEER
ncbi:hypothetical protein Anas_08967 [Armadillidium nasatum]|uniref:Uncharacterized protein n=1 Tax=Armadillidium nasatum TaxID=96803 RepID=A0A5N5TKJ4_9CRUS|nr:hypothetical protein Anas_08967 [Armadillidium nasatum]